MTRTRSDAAAAGAAMAQKRQDKRNKHSRRGREFLKIDPWKICSRDAISDQGRPLDRIWVNDEKVGAAGGGTHIVGAQEEATQWHRTTSMIATLNGIR
jgi:hypothetical protein